MIESRQLDRQKLQTGVSQMSMDIIWAYYKSYFFKYRYLNYHFTNKTNSSGFIKIQF